MSELNSPTELTLTDIARSREQQVGVIYNKAVEILNASPFDDLREVAANESTYLASPNLLWGPDFTDRHNYAVATLIDDATGEAPIGSPMYLIIDDNFISPLVQLERYDTGRSITYLGDASAQVKDDTVPAILDRMLSEQRSNSAKIEYQNTNRQESLTERRLALFAVAAGAGLLSGVMQSIDAYHNAQEAAEAETIQTFDEQNLQLPGEPIVTGETEYASSYARLFETNEVPLLEGDITDEVRTFEITAGTCESVGRADIGSDVLAVTDGASDIVVIARTNDGNVEACALDDNYSDNSSAVLNVAVQTR